MTKKFDAIVGFDPDRAGEENYFYVRPGEDASIIIQAAVDYVSALQDSWEKRANRRRKFPRFWWSDTHPDPLKIRLVVLLGNDDSNIQLTLDPEDILRLREDLDRIMSSSGFPQSSGESMNEG